MRIPLHGKATKSEIFDLHVRAQQLNPKGFRKAPTSPKNPKTRSPHPTTRIERLAREVYGR